MCADGKNGFGYCTVALYERHLLEMTVPNLKNIYIAMPCCHSLKLHPELRF